MLSCSFSHARTHEHNQTHTHTPITQVLVLVSALTGSITAFLSNNTDIRFLIFDGVPDTYLQTYTNIAAAVGNKSLVCPLFSPLIPCLALSLSRSLSLAHTCAHVRALFDSHVPRLLRTWIRMYILVYIMYVFIYMCAKTWCHIYAYTISFVHTEILSVSYFDTYRFILLNSQLMYICMHEFLDISKRPVKRYTQTPWQMHTNKTSIAVKMGRSACRRAPRPRFMPNENFTSLPLMLMATQ